MGNLPDETKFAAAFGGLSVQGLTKAKLLETATTYIGVIDEDSKKFNSALDSKILSEIKTKRTNAENDLF
jgi:hypothetical protein